MGRRSTTRPRGWLCGGSGVRLTTRHRRPRVSRAHRALGAAVTTIVALSVLAVGCSDPLADAEALALEGDLAAAESAYREILLETPNNLEVLEGLAVVLMLQQKYDEALPIQESVVAVNPEDVQTRIELGFNYLNHQDRPDDAVRVFSEAAAIDGTAKHLVFLAQAQREAGRLEDAEMSVRRAIEVDPEYSHSYAVLIRLLEQGGRSDEAADTREQAAAHGITIDTAQSAQ